MELQFIYLPTSHTQTTLHFLHTIHTSAQVQTHKITDTVHILVKYARYAQRYTLASHVDRHHFRQNKGIE